MTSLQHLIIEGYCSCPQFSLKKVEFKFWPQIYWASWVPISEFSNQDKLRKRDNEDSDLQCEWLETAHYAVWFSSESAEFVRRRYYLPPGALSNLLYLFSHLSAVSDILRIPDSIWSHHRKQSWGGRKWQRTWSWRTDTNHSFRAPVPLTKAELGIPVSCFLAPPQPHPYYIFRKLYPP